MLIKEDGAISKTSSQRFGMSRDGNSIVGEILLVKAEERLFRQNWYKRNSHNTNHEQSERERDEGKETGYEGSFKLRKAFSTKLQGQVYLLLLSSFLLRLLPI